MNLCLLLVFCLSAADPASVDERDATAWDYARARQLHYCMLIIASYIRQQQKQDDVSSPDGATNSAQVVLAYSNRLSSGRWVSGAVQRVVIKLGGKLTWCRIVGVEPSRLDWIWIVLSDLI